MYVCMYVCMYLRKYVVYSYRIPTKMWFLESLGKAGQQKGHGQPKLTINQKGSLPLPELTCIYTNTCINTYICTCTDTWIACLHTYLHPYHICMYTYLHTCMHTCNILAYLYVAYMQHTCIPTYKHACLYATCIHTHTHLY